MVNWTELSPDAQKSLAFTPAELEELARARSMPITFDEDCPEVTPEQAIRFKRVNPSRKTSDSSHS